MYNPKGNGEAGHGGSGGGGEARAKPDEFQFGAESAAEIFSGPLEDPGYLIKGLMPASGLHVLYGPPGVGKSFLALDMALHVAAGLGWAGKRVVRGGSCVVYVASEGSRAFKRRIVTAMRERGIGADIPFLLVRRAPRLGPGHACERDAFIDQIATQAGRLGVKPRLIVLDTLARSMVGLDESSSKDMGCFIEDAARLSEEFGDALVMPVHHTGKDAERGMRGSSALHGAADAMWQVRRDDKGLNFLVEKMKDGPSGFEVRFALRDVVVGVDADGDPATTRVVEFAADPVQEAAPLPQKKTRAVGLAAVLRVVKGILAESGKTSAEGAPAAAGVRKALLGKDLHKAAVAKLFGGGGYADRDSARSAYNSRLKKLTDAGDLVELDGWIWVGRDDSKLMDDAPF